MELCFSISFSIAIQPPDDPVSRTTLADIYKEGGPLDSDILACKIGFQDCSDVLPDKWFERKVSHQGNCFKINPNGKYNASIAGHLGGMSLFLHAQNKQYSLVSFCQLIFRILLLS